jgi:hypothetical protein
MGRSRQAHGVQITGLSNKIGTGHRHHHAALHQPAVREGVDGEGHDVGFGAGDWHGPTQAHPQPIRA